MWPRMIIRGRDSDVAAGAVADTLATMTVYNAKGAGDGLQTQATKYLYGSVVNASLQTGVVYPDSTDVLSQSSTTKVWTMTTNNGDHVSTTYDRLGRKTTLTDQWGVQHTYSYDAPVVCRRIP